jgi:DtxR family Mn-dependent transcriptional regulator
MREKSLEDYLEAIYKLRTEKGNARISDISLSLRVKKPSVTEMVQKLSKEGFVVYKPYQNVELTSKGERLAKAVLYRHNLLRNFLKIIGIDEHIAEEDACKIEHSLHPETVKRLAKFVEFIQSEPKNLKLLEHYKYFYDTGKYPTCLDE